MWHGSESPQNGLSVEDAEQLEAVNYSQEPRRAFMCPAHDSCRPDWVQIVFLSFTIWIANKGNLLICTCWWFGTFVNGHDYAPQSQPTFSSGLKLEQQLGKNLILFSY